MTDVVQPVRKLAKLWGIPEDQLTADIISATHKICRYAMSCSKDCPYRLPVRGAEPHRETCTNSGIPDAHDMIVDNLLIDFTSAEMCGARTPNFHASSEKPYKCGLDTLHSCGTISCIHRVPVRPAKGDRVICSGAEACKNYICDNKKPQKLDLSKLSMSSECSKTGKSFVPYKGEVIKEMDRRRNAVENAAAIEKAARNG